ncbi:hypothetical protein JXO59_02275 [candidate division KSB1 bacterium]|nr:hypothetical protein [candidate division KSB1 bacterium]
MNLDEIKSKTRKVRVPDLMRSSMQPSVHSMNDLIDALKVADEAERKKARRMMLFFILSGALWAFVLILNLVMPSSLSQQQGVLHRGLLALWLLAIGLYSGHIARRHAKVNYSEPLSIFLAQAKKRYSLIEPRGIVFTILILPIALFCIMAAGDYMTYVFQRYISADDLYLVSIVFYFFILLVFILGSVFTYKNWQRERAPYWRKIKEELIKLRLYEANSSVTE